MNDSEIGPVMFCPLTGFAVNDKNLPALVMGVLNVTPDSFSDGGLYLDRRKASTRAMRMLEQGAAIIDVGGESTRPGAAEVSSEEELDRVIPVIESIRSESDCPISVDTSKPTVMQAAIDAGASLLNDVRGFSEPGALEVAARSDLPICIMHMQGSPDSMQEAPEYTDVVAEVSDYLARRSQAAIAAGVKPERIIIDPGFGFGKSLEHNLQLFGNLPALHRLEMPILIGVSRKSLFGQLLDRPADQRVAGSVAMAAMATLSGVSIIRAHDIEQTVDAVRTAQAVKRAG